MAGQDIELGVIFPTKDIGSDSSSILNFGPAAERLGLDFIDLYDHVVGVNQQYLELDTENTNCVFDSTTNVHEPLIALAGMAALTTNIRLVTSCLVAPQRPAVLTAKQAAELDIISGGRLELGVSIGWNKPEFQALGANFDDRASSLEQQIPLMRDLWTKEDVLTTDDNGNSLHVNLLPRPIQQPIPMWIGGLSAKAVKRAANLQAGWLPLGYINEEIAAKAADYYSLASQQNNQVAQVMGRLNPWQDSHKQAIRQFTDWREAGATHLAIGTSENSFENTEQYFNELSKFLGYIRSKAATSVFWMPDNGKVQKMGAETSGETEPLKEPFICIVTGTHSAGKSTLLSGFESGKLSDLDIFHNEYDDLGYGLFTTPEGDTQHPIITVPEAARWLAEVQDRPEALADQYSLDFQTLVDSEVMFRLHEAAALTEIIVQRMLDKGILDPAKAIGRPIIISDRGPLDGIVYSQERVDGDTNVVNGFGRTGFAAEWLKSFVDLAIVSDHTDVPLQSDPSRLNDLDFRNRVAAKLETNYRHFLTTGNVEKITGDNATRMSKVIELITAAVKGETSMPPSTPYEAWQDIKLVS